MGISPLWCKLFFELYVNEVTNNFFGKNSLGTREGWGNEWVESWICARHWRMVGQGFRQHDTEAGRGTSKMFERVWDTWHSRYHCSAVPLENYVTYTFPSIRLDPGHLPPSPFTPPHPKSQPCRSFHCAHNAAYPESKCCIQNFLPRTITEQRRTEQAHEWHNNIKLRQNYEMKMLCLMKQMPSIKVLWP